MIVLIFEHTNEYQFPSHIQQRIKKTLLLAYDKARAFLPSLNQEITVSVIPTHKVIPETGSGGYCPNQNTIEIRINPWHEIPLEEIIDKNIGATLCHELHHAARWNSVGWGQTAIEGAISEGLATEFENQFSNKKVLWGMYDISQISQWVEELIALSDHKMSAEEHKEWFIKHRDGRRWIGYKVGVFIVETTIKRNLGESAATLVDRSAMDVMNMGGFKV